MTERPIIFSASMVRALLEGRKTMTRRLLKPVKGVTFADLEPGAEHSIGRWMRVPRDKLQEPRIAVGDRLWVRETYRPLHSGDRSRGAEYRADKPAWWLDQTVFKSPIHMPRWASRLTLTVTGVKVERLQEISEADARDEGVFISWATMQTRAGTGRQGFEQIWNSIHCAGAWESNPWVAAISFTVEKRNIDARAEAA